MKIDIDGKVEGINTQKQTYPIGIILTVICFITFYILIYKLIGNLSLLVSPIVSLLACRPIEGSDLWLWERRVK